MQRDHNPGDTIAIFYCTCVDNFSAFVYMYIGDFFERTAARKHMLLAVFSNSQ